MRADAIETRRVAFVAGQQPQAQWVRALSRGDVTPANAE
jgi:hypothetical protein